MLLSKCSVLAYLHGSMGAIEILAPKPLSAYFLQFIVHHSNPLQHPSHKLLNLCMRVQWNREIWWSANADTILALLKGVENRGCCVYCVAIIVPWATCNLHALMVLHNLVTLIWLTDASFSYAIIFCVTFIQLAIFFWFSLCRGWRRSI